MDRNLVILAGGISSRMKRAASAPAELDPILKREAHEKSKSMIGVGEGHRPFLDYLLYNAREAGVTDVVIVIGERDNSIREYYGPADEGNDVAGLRVSYAVQKIPPGREKPFGTADALLQGLRGSPARRWSRFIVCNSDNLYSKRALALMRECADPGGMIDYDRSALVFSQDRIEQFAVTETSADGYLVRIVEKPSPDVIAKMQSMRGRVGVSMNIFCLSYEMIFPILERVLPDPVRQEKELPTAVQMMTRIHPRSVRAIPLAEHVPDLTNQSDIPRVQEYLRKAYPAFSLAR